MGEPKYFSSLGMSNLMPFLSASSLMLNTSSMGMCNSASWVVRYKLRLGIDESITLRIRSIPLLVSSLKATASSGELEESE